jgi:two-component system, chemotaxis family, sensor kinase CheA
MDSKIFDTLLEPTFILDADGRIIYCNEPGALISDSSVRKIQRSKPKFTEVFNFAAQIHGLDKLTTMTESIPYQEVSFATPSGKSGKVQITLQPFSFHKDPPTWLVYFRDVTLEETLQKKYRAELEKKEDVIKDLQSAQAELKNYSENLEKMVAERTAEIARMNQTMQALLDSLAQGFFIFDKDGTCLPFFSKACTTTIECQPAGKKIWEIFKIPSAKVESFKKWLVPLFSEMLPFADVAAIGPQIFEHSQHKSIKLEYYPLRDQNAVLAGVVVVATDITDLVHAQEEAETEKAHAKMIVKMIKDRRPFASFLRETETLLVELVKEISKPKIDPQNSFRLLHTLKGGSATFSIKKVAEQCHESETALSLWKEYPTPENEKALREKALQVPKNHQEFLLENKELLANIQRPERYVEIPVSKLSQFEKILPSEAKAAFSEQFLMEPIGHFFSGFNDAVQQVARQESKKIAPLVFHNDKVKILPEPYENLLSTFVHAYRNAADHGIESESLRQERNKPPEGKIETWFSLDKNILTVQIKDDGGGVDPEKIRSKLKKQNIQCDSETDQQVIQHIFDSQFSTKEQVTEISGRGVGMDAIMFAVKKLGGKCWVESQVGLGTALFVQVPYILSLSKNQKKAA